MKFEEVMAKLEKIVDELEEGKLPLDASLKKYEDGIKYVKFLSKKLDEVQKKIDVLVKTKDGKVTLMPFKMEE